MAAISPRAKLLALFALFALPVLAGYLLAGHWRPQGSVNYGQLLTPTPLPDAVLKDASGTPVRLADLRGHWLLLQLDEAACAEACQRKLYLMRQLRATQGRQQERIERLWLLADGAQPAPELLREYEGTRVLRVAGTGLPALLPAPASPRDHVYVVDPLGNLMLRFPADPDPSLMKRDLSRLLKYSKSG